MESDIMKECICNTCRNLKEVEEEQYICEFGFPDAACEQCENEGCDRECSHYAGETVVEVLTEVQCCICGKTLRKMIDEEEEGDVYCIDCYLAREV